MTFLLGFILLIFFTIIVCTPYITRKTESFGVTIPEEIYHTSQLRDMRKKYVYMTTIFSIIITIICWIGITVFEYNENTLGILFSILVVFYMIGAFFIYLKFHRQMKQLKQAKKWGNEKSQLVVVDTAFHNQQLTYSNLWFLIYFIVTLTTVIITFQFYDRIPEMIPLNYDLFGEVTKTAPKSYRSVLILPVTQFFMTAIFLFCNIMIAKAKQQISAANPKQSTIQNVTFRRRWSAFIIIMGTAFIFMFTLIQLSIIFPIHQQIIMIVSLVITFGSILGAIILSITTGQGGSRVKTGKSENGEVIDRDDDRYWKLGQFYFNKNDPSIFLEKRFGVGWTINCAHPLSWVIIIGIILLAVGIPMLLTM